MIRYSRSYIDRLTIKLYDLIYPYKDQISYVVGIAHGGLHISQPLARYLDRPHHSIHISRYNSSILRAEPIVEGKLLKPTGNLIVDDLIDDGGTIKLFSKQFGLTGNKVAVLFWKPGSFKPDFYAEEKPDSWIYFPWS